MSAHPHPSHLRPKIASWWFTMLFGFWTFGYFHIIIHLLASGDLSAWGLHFPTWLLELSNSLSPQKEHSLIQRQATHPDGLVFISSLLLMAWPRGPYSQSWWAKRWWASGRQNGLGHTLFVVLPPDRCWATSLVEGGAGQRSISDMVRDITPAIKGLGCGGFC